MEQKPWYFWLQWVFPLLLFYRSLPEGWRLSLLPLVFAQAPHSRASCQWLLCFFINQFVYWFMKFTAKLQSALAHQAQAELFHTEIMGRSGAKRQFIHLSWWRHCLHWIQVLSSRFEQTQTEDPASCGWLQILSTIIYFVLMMSCWKILGSKSWLWVWAGNKMAFWFVCISKQTILYFSPKCKSKLSECFVLDTAVRPLNLKYQISLNNPVHFTMARTHTVPVRWEEMGSSSGENNGALQTPGHLCPSWQPLQQWG